MRDHCKKPRVGDRMKLYGSELINAGILILIIAAAFGIIFLILHIVFSLRLKRILEAEYGKEKKEEGSINE